MNTQTLPPNSKNVLPAVGQPWKHDTGTTVFIRIMDRYGLAIFDRRADDDMFFSVNTRDGSIVETCRNNDNRVLLEGAGPTGEVQFRPVITA